RVAQVRQQIRRQPRPPRLAHQLLVPLDAAERQPRRALRLHRRQPRTEMLLPLHLDVEAQLLVQLPLHRVPAEQRAELLEDPSQRVHVRLLVVAHAAVWRRGERRWRRAAAPATHPAPPARRTALAVSSWPAPAPPPAPARASSPSPCPARAAPCASAGSSARAGCSPSAPSRSRSCPAAPTAGAPGRASPG